MGPLICHMLPSVPSEIPLGITLSSASILLQLASVAAEARMLFPFFQELGWRYVVGLWRRVLTTAKASAKNGPDEAPQRNCMDRWSRRRPNMLKSDRRDSSPAPALGPRMPPESALTL